MTFAFNFRRLATRLLCLADIFEILRTCRSERILVDFIKQQHLPNTPDEFTDPCTVTNGANAAPAVRGYYQTERIIAVKP